MVSNTFVVGFYLGSIHSILTIIITRTAGPVLLRHVGLIDQRPLPAEDQTPARESRVRAPRVIRSDWARAHEVAENEDEDEDTSGTR